MTARRPRRRLAGDLVQATGLSLGEFDVLAQLAVAGGELRMSELADRALSSRSGMTRRVTRLVEESLVTRTTDDADARGGVVALTEAGIARLAEAAPVHLRDVVELFARSSATRSSISSRARSTRSLSSARSVPEETGLGSATRIRGAPANP
jgi:DNA-binding MarR family transcriptional regulator